MFRIGWVMTSILLVSCASSHPEATVPEPSEATTAVEKPEPDTAESTMPSSGLAADVHLHIDKGEGRGLTRVREMMKEQGFGRAAAISPAYQVAPDCEPTACDSQREWTQEMNDWAVQQLLPAGRVVVICGVPLGYEWGADEARRCVKAGGKGIKLHTMRDGIALANAETARQVGSILEFAAAKAIPVLIHVRFEAPEVQALFKLAEDNPEATIIAAHQLGPMMPMLLQAPDNIMTDVSGLTLISAEQRASILPLWRAFGTDRILLGSDWPELEPKDHLDALRSMGVTDDELSAISRGNFDKLFGE